MTEKSKNLKPGSTYFIKERNLVKWLSVILCPFLVAIIVALCDKDFAIWLPSFSMYQCSDWQYRFPNKSVEAYHNAINLAIMTYVNYEFIMCSLFFLCTFWLRNINDEFSINYEIRVMTTCLFVSNVLYICSLMFLYESTFVVLGFVQYIEVILCLSLLYLTAIKPIYKSYQPNAIIPFPLS